MPERQLVGSRIRNRRLDMGLRQADLARAVGISPSYLNLIEHNRRRIGGKLLQDIARELEADPALLAEGSAAGQLAPLREAAVAVPDGAAELPRIEDFAARFPGWASIVTAQHERIKTLEDRVRVLTDQLTHDPQIATSLHEVLSTATAIRSTASILVESDDLDADWQRRFHQNIDSDSRRLAESSRALMERLDLNGDGAEAIASPLEEAEAFFERRDHNLPELETGRVTPEEIAAGVTSPLARRIVEDRVRRLARDAEALPASVLLPAALRLDCDPLALSAELGVPVGTVLRRLATLPRGTDLPEMGLAVCDAAGVITFQRPALGFALPRLGAGCPLWPLYRAISSPGLVIRRRVSLPGRAGEGRDFDCTAVAEPVGAEAPNLPPRVIATMLVRALTTSGDGMPAPDPVGPGCRVCPRSNCAARREPSVLAPASDATL